MSTHSDYSRDSYPANKHILQAIGGIKGHLLCRIFWATNLKDGVCRMGITRLGEEIGFDRSTVLRNERLLIADGYIKEVKQADPANGQPAHYQVTQKFYDLLPVADSTTTRCIAQHPPLQTATPPVAQRNKDIDTDIESSDNNSNGKNPLYGDTDEYDSLPDVVKQSLRTNDTDWQYLVKRFKSVRMDLSINPAKEDDLWRLYKSLTPPVGETVGQWVDYVAGRVADKPTTPGWKFVETIFEAIQASGSLAKNIAEFEGRYKANGAGALTLPSEFKREGGGIYL
jgi:hypothetical protein